jgi:predicted metal-dependent phosphotriesterase family hydrolase
MAITHAINLGMTVAQMQEAAKEGAYIEFCALSLVTAKPNTTPAVYASAMRQVGPASVILSSDLGQPENPLPPDGLAKFLALLQAEGLSAQEIKTMSEDNPAKLLGLAPQ